MGEWKEYKIDEVAKISTGFAFSGDEYEFKGILRVVRGENVTIGNLRWDSEKYWNKATNGLDQYYLQENDIVIGMDGSRVGHNRAKIKSQELPLILAQRVARLRAKEGFDQEFLWYHIFSDNFKDYVEAVHTGTSIPHISQKQIADFEIFAPILESEQTAIASILSSLDDKIDLLHRQNATLEKLAETLFRQWFVEEAKEEWESKQLKEVTDIAIGRTPPRKESKWFTTNPLDIKWISIKDLGDDGMFISNTTEYLTKEAVDTFNIPVIPKDTIVLSFKMTVGRVAITSEEMLSNEAIAHFKFNNNTPFCKEYLYLFLKTYKYETLGSTSSIVTAINSAMIKEMGIVIPNECTMMAFKEESEPLFNKIKSNQTQIRTITALRDTLLPKLMSGEVRVEPD